MIEQNDPIELNRERRIKLSILERIFNSTDKTLFQKLNGEHPAAEDSHTWLFQFVDIIYVGTVANISRFVDRCGAGDMDGSLFVASFSYLVIMFYTRTAFDSYVSISKAGGIIHVAVFCLYAAAVFVMSVNIAGARVKDGEVPGKEFGQCTAEEAHIHAFTSGFIASRVVLLVMYFLYLNVFHESHVTGTFKENLADVTRDTLTAFKRASAKRSSTEIPLDDRLTIGSAISYVSSARAGVVKKHFTGIYCCKIFPLAASAVVMLALVLSKQHPVVIFPTIATMELLADILPSFLSDEEWKKFLLNIHLAKDRLGLFFMLVMGEAMLGFHAVYYGANHSSPESYTVLM